jgi:leader peptidase (prepilin peptidase) / N-methyltransferase
MNSSLSSLFRAQVGAGAFCLAYALAALPVVWPPVVASDFVFSTSLAILLVWISCVDVARFAIPDTATYGVAVLGAIYAGSTVGSLELASRLAAALLFVAGFWLAGEAHFRLLGKEGLGIGDAKFIGAAALWVDPYELWTLLFLAAVGGIVIALFAMRAKRDGQVPFGPFLCFALYLLTIHGMTS